jgi:hypothetical protein
MLHCLRVLLLMLLGMTVWTWSAKAESFVGITACQVINAPGEYRVMNDLSGTTGQSCLNIKSSDVTIDGNGKNIIDTSGNYAVLILSDATPWSNISVSNFTSPNGVWTYRSASYVVFDQVTIGSYSVSAADHTSLTNSVINGTVSITNLNLENPTYAVFSNNQVIGSNSRLAFFSGDNHIEGNCDTTGMTINDNTFTNTVSSIADNPVTVFLGCTQNGSFSGNTVHSSGQATGLLIRDGYSYNILANNTVRVNNAVNDTRGAVALVSGSLGGAPNYNTFRENTVIGENSKALFHYLETYGNVYQNNLFVSNRDRKSVV